MLYLAYLVTGLLAGVVGGLLGTGGCAIIMPVIRFGFNFDPALAVGTTLTAVVFTAASGAVQHSRMGNVDRRSALITGASGVLGVIIGSVAFTYVKAYGSLIDLIIGLAFLLVTLRMIWEGGQGLLSKNPLPEAVASDGLPGSSLSKGLTGSGIGFLTGIIGLGGGYALVPAFLYMFKAPMRFAIGTSMASFFWIALVGAAIKIYQQVVNIPVAITLGLGAVIGAIFGAKLVARFKPALLKFIFGLLFLYVALKYIFIYFGVTI
jgi:hypothetical protein